MVFICGLEVRATEWNWWSENFKKTEENKVKKNNTKIYCNHYTKSSEDYSRDYEDTDSEIKELIDDLEEIRENGVCSATDYFTGRLAKRRIKYQDNLEYCLNDKIKQIWENTNGAKDKNERLKQSEIKINNAYKDDIKILYDKFIEIFSDWWNTSQEFYKNWCIEVIKASEYLKANEKESLKEVIININSIPYEKESPYDEKMVKKISFGKIDLKEWKDFYIESYINVTVEMGMEFVRLYSAKFDEWVKKLNKSLIENLKQFYPCVSMLI